MPAIDLAQELTDRILDALSNDKTSLAFCSLVHRSWLPRSRFHLFRIVALHEKRTIRRTEVHRENVSEFLELVQSPRCSFLPAVETGVIGLLYISDTEQDLLNKAVSALARCHALEKLVFWYPRLDFRKTISSVSWIAEALPQVRDFSYNTSGHVDDDALRLISSFPALKSLSVYTSHNSQITGHLVSLKGGLLSNIRTLRLRLVDSEEATTWFQNTSPVLQYLETLDLQVFRSGHDGWGPVAHLKLLLESTKDSLKELRISVEYNPAIKAHGNSDLLDLSCLSNLRSIMMRTHDTTAILDSLSTLCTASPPLEELDVQIMPDTFVSGRCSCDGNAHDQLVDVIGKIFCALSSLRTVDLRIPEKLPNNRESNCQSLAKRLGSQIGQTSKAEIRVSFTEPLHDQVGTIRSLKHLFP